jgi:hypothetical protein
MPHSFTWIVWSWAHRQGGLPPATFVTRKSRSRMNFQLLFAPSSIMQWGIRLQYIETVLLRVHAVKVLFAIDSNCSLLKEQQVYSNTWVKQPFDS